MQTATCSIATAASIASPPASAAARLPPCLGRTGRHAEPTLFDRASTSAFDAGHLPHEQLDADSNLARSRWPGRRLDRWEPSQRSVAFAAPRHGRVCREPFSGDEPASGASSARCRHRDRHGARQHHRVFQKQHLRTGSSHRPGADGVVEQQNSQQECFQNESPLFRPTPPGPVAAPRASSCTTTAPGRRPLSHHFIVASQGHELERFRNPSAAGRPAPQRSRSIRIRADTQTQPRRNNL